jgi:hypothetical protein
MLLFVIGILATYRLALFLHDEKGPFDLLEHWHDWLDANPYQFNPGFDGDFLRMLRRLFDCYWCLSIWTAIFISVWFWWGDWAMVSKAWLALSGGAILIYETSKTMGSVGGTHTNEGS